MSIIHEALKKVEASAGIPARSSSGGLFAQAQEGENGVGFIFVLLLAVFLAVSFSWAYLQKTGRPDVGPYPFSVQTTSLKPPATEAAPLGGHLKNGMGLYRAGKLDDALIQLELALEAAPDDPVVHNNIGAVYAAKKEYTAAEQFFIKASGSLGYAEAFNNRGAVVIKLGRAEEAMGHFKTALAINPGYADAHLNAAAAYEKAGDAENALAHYRSYLDLSADTETKTSVAEKIPALTGAILWKHRSNNDEGH